MSWLGRFSSGVAHYTTAAPRTTLFTSDAILLRALTRRQLRYRSNDAEQASAEVRWLLDSLRPSAPLTRKQRRRLILMTIQMTRKEKPLGYVIGSQPFSTLPQEIVVRPPTLIPRPETEDWAQRVAEALPTKWEGTYRILDLCTGTGCIAALLAHTLKSRKDKWEVVAADISEEAVQLAKENAPGVKVLQADLFSDRDMKKLGGTFDLVVSNPPYIPRAEWEGLDPSVKEWEDPRALIGGSSLDGLDFYRRIARLAQDPAFLKPSVSGRKTPRLVVEFGKGQQESVRNILQAKKRFMIAGLGNYTFPLTRHSVGQIVLDSLATRFSAPLLEPNREARGWSSTLTLALDPNPPKGSAAWRKGVTLPLQEVEVVLYKPRYLMNENGKGLARALKVFGVERQDVLVLHDELSRPFGKVAYKEGGSAAGHNGVKSCLGELKGDIQRLRIGIGRPEDVGLNQNTTRWVLGKLDSSQLDSATTGEVLSLTAETIRKWLLFSSPTVEVQPDLFGIPRTACKY